MTRRKLKPANSQKQRQLAARQQQLGRKSFLEKLEDRSLMAVLGPQIDNFERVGTNLNLHFSEPMDAESMQAAEVWVADAAGQRTPLTFVSYSEESQIASFYVGDLLGGQHRVFTNADSLISSEGLPVAGEPEFLASLAGADSNKLVQLFDNNGELGLARSGMLPTGRTPGLIDAAQTPGGETLVVTERYTTSEVYIQLWGNSAGGMDLGVHNVGVDGFTDLQLGDIDRDGNSDIVAVSLFNQFSVSLGNDDNTFAEPIVVDLVGRGKGVALVEMEDGVEINVVVEGGIQSFELTDGELAETAFTPLQVDGEPASGVLEDGSEVLVIPSAAARSMTIFDPHTNTVLATISLPNSPLKAVLAELESGVKSIAYVANDKTVNLIANNNGTWQHVQSRPIYQNATDLIALVNSDGLTTIVVSSTNENQREPILTFQPADGRLGFGEAISVGVPASAHGLAVAELNSTTYVGSFEIEMFEQKFDFGTAKSSVAEGHTQVTNRTGYTRTRGYGFVNTANLTAVDRHTGDDAAGDFVQGKRIDFKLNVPRDGDYEVELVMGDPKSVRDFMDVRVEDELLETIALGRGEVRHVTVTVPVTDGVLNISLVDKGGKTPRALINALIVKEAAASTAKTPGPLAEGEASPTIALQATSSIATSIDAFGYAQLSFSAAASETRHEVFLQTGSRLKLLGEVRTRSNGTAGYKANFAEPGKTYDFVIKSYNSKGVQTAQRIASATVPLLTDAAKINAAIINSLKVETTRKYQPDANGTKCNVFVDDATEQLSNRWGVNAVVRAEPTAQNPGWVRANDQYNWLLAGGNGYREVSGEEAAKQAALGQIVVAAWFNPQGHPGHIAKVVGTTEKYQASRGPLVAQAGATNFSAGWAVDGFGRTRLPQVKFFVFKIQ